MSKNEKEFQFDFDNDTKINPNKLHEECFNYGRMAWKYGEALADAVKVKEKAHETVKITRSELILAARKDPVACGLSKSVKNDEIESYYRTHPDHIKAKEELIEAEHTVNVLQAGNNSMQFAKSTGLEGAITLWKGEYFSVEGVPVEVPENWKAWKEDKRQRTSDKQRDRTTEKMRRTKP